MDRLGMLQKLSASFARENIKTETILIYLDMLRDVPDNLLEYSVAKCINTCRFFPTVSEIRTVAAEYRNSVSPNPIKPWSEVDREIHNAMRHYGVIDVVPWSCPLVRELMKDRWRTFCEMTNDEQGTAYAQTRMAYEGMCRQKKWEIESGEAIASLPPTTRQQLQSSKLNDSVKMLSNKFSEKEKKE